MKFHAVTGTRVLFSIWETRVSDWNAYLLENRRPKTPGARFAFHQTDAHPVVNVTATEAGEFCDWLTRRERAAHTLTSAQSFRLPTNAEWDAAVGVSPRTEASNTGGEIEPCRFPWGTEWPPPPRAGNYNTDLIAGKGDDGFKFTAPVGQFDPTPDGLFDLGGNAWEWTVDSAAEGAATACLRGGSWMYWRKDCLESSFRLRVKPGVRAPSIGFRCVLADEAVARADRQRDAADAKSKRLELSAKPRVTDDEVHAMRSQLVERRAEAASAARAIAGNSAASGREFVNSIGIKMLPLPGTDVLLGEHEVRIADFNIYADQNGLPRCDGSNNGGNPNHPVTGVTWADAVSFCLWLTQRERARDLLPPEAIYRLPALAEWRAAFRDRPSGTAAPSGYPWGNSWPPPGDYANVDRTNGLPESGRPGRLLPVKSLRANALGFFDLVGNAAEWCRDVRPETDTERTHCGGSWTSSRSEDLQDGGACGIPATAVRADVGFRLSLDLRPPGKLSFQQTLKAERRR